MADLTPETVPAVDGVVAEFTASLADIEKGSSSLAQPRPPLSFLSHCLLTRKLFVSPFCFDFENCKTVWPDNFLDFGKTPKQLHMYVGISPEYVIVVCQLSNKTIQVA